MCLQATVLPQQLEDLCLSMAVLPLGPASWQSAAAELFHPRKCVRAPAQMFVVQKKKVWQTVRFKAGSSGNRVGSWARKAICNVPVSHCDCVPLHNVLLVFLGTRGRVFLIHKNAIENFGCILIFPCDWVLCPKSLLNKACSHEDQWCEGKRSMWPSPRTQWAPSSHIDTFSITIAGRSLLISILKQYSLLTSKASFGKGRTHKWGQ